MFKKSIRYIALFLALVFLVFAILQYNDPDPFIWIPIYLLASILSICVAINKIKIKILVTASVLFLLGAAFTFPSTYNGVWLDMGYKVEIEEARESLGLLICGLSMAFYVIVLTKNKSITDHPQNSKTNA
ncbi:MAG: transmembrane 220 family protein [Bacteroidota bacterium]|nr:transmembrane 220 family protein [Bacteroidota bacterium]